MYNGRWLANKWIHIIHQNLIMEGWKFWYVNLIQTNDSVAWNVWQNGLDFRKTAQLTNNKHHARVFGLILVPKYYVFIQNQDKNIPSAEHHGGQFFLNPIVDSRPCSHMRFYDKQWISSKKKNTQSTKMVSECIIGIRFSKKKSRGRSPDPLQLRRDIPSRTHNAAPLQDWSTTPSDSAQSF